MDGSPGALRGPSLDVTIVVPARNEAGNVEALVREVTAVMEPLALSYAFLFIDDGSDDDTPGVLARLASADRRIGYLRLSRNFGLQAALTAGLAHAEARATIVMDCDLQDDPAAIPRMIEAWRLGADIAYAVRTRRREGLFKRMAIRAFHWMIGRVADIPIPRDAGSFGLYDRRVIEQIRAMPEANRYLPGLRSWVGFRQVPIPVERRARHSGRPAQSFARLVQLALDGMLAFSKAPLRLAAFLGFGVTALSALGFAVVFYWRFVERSFPAGVGLATIALALLFLGGVQLLVIGIIGEYLGRVYDEVKRRPQYVVLEDRRVGAAEVQRSS